MHVDITDIMFHIIIIIRMLTHVIMHVGGKICHHIEVHLAALFVFYPPYNFEFSMCDETLDSRQSLMLRVTAFRVHDNTGVEIGMKGPPSRLFANKI